MTAQIVAGALAGIAFGYVLKRDDLCFHSMFRGIYDRRFLLAKIWLVGWVLGAVGLGLIFELGPWDQLLVGLRLRPVDNLIGGTVFGIGMVIAASCVSGLFYKLGSGMLGAAVGLVGWVGGELAARQWWTPLGPTIEGFNERATVYGQLGVHRWVVIVPLVVVVAVALARGRRDEPTASWQWGWVVGGTALAGVLVAGWVTAGVSGTSFGPSTVGAAASVARGGPNWWLLAFLLAIVAGAAIAARTAGGWWVRGESVGRYAQLVVGGAVLGAGGWIGGGCNVGHGLSGMAQLNVSSILAVSGMAAGVGIARAVQMRVARPLPDWRPGAADTADAGTG